METFYLICAGGGGALVICQFLASLFGLSGGHDVDTDHDVSGDAHTGTDTHHDQPHNAFLGLLTFRSIAAAITFFGLGGLTARYYESTDATAFTVALVAAVAALYLVGTLMKTMYKLKADGTVRMERAVGQVGRVYLTIPGKKAGSGKVTFNMQNRTVECLAMTAANDITTGSTVTVVAVLGPNLVEVSPLPAA
jgi:membrane protein implicated in regulation of membrane protease activity